MILPTQMGSISLVQRMMRNWSWLEELAGTLVAELVGALVTVVTAGRRLLHGIMRSRYQSHTYRLWSMTVKTGITYGGMQYTNR
jgi:hypothetical protein